ncbi:hypothetical protein CDL12_24945 [Handroanthus impetiginosus]|uniref:Mitochondrial import inner membrane translocase subunit Tim21 n=1 Tax=Handroanthus impetiginosus TaxID=429701 RepID=A0A2G9GBH0_9LAMI|nr:hypothetical protein CDL12_24945 [Handroanthus impetiginosus]
MNRIMRSGLNILRSSLRASSNADVGFAGFSSLATERSVTTVDFFKRVFQCRDQHALIYRSPIQLAMSAGQKMRGSCFIRCFASNTTESNRQKESETREDMSLDDKRSTYNNGDLVFVAVAVALSVALCVALPVALFAATEHQALNESNVYKIFSKSLERVQNDSQVKVRIGSPIMGCVSGFPITSDGSEPKNILTDRSIPNRTWIEDGTEHILVKFLIHGPNGDGLAMSIMFKDRVDKQWKFKYLIVEFESPAHAQLVLEELDSIRLIRTV